MASKAHSRIFVTVALVLAVLLYLLVGSAAAAQTHTKCQKAHKAACKRDSGAQRKGKGHQGKGKGKRKAKRHRKQRLAVDQRRVNQPGGAVDVSSDSKGSSKVSGGSSGPSSSKGKEKSTPTPPVEESTKPVEEATEPVEEATKPVEEATKPVEEAVGDTCVSIAAIAQATWAPSCWRPYSNASPWNQPVSASAPSTANSSAVVQRLASWGPVQNLIAGNSESGSDYYHPIYFSSAADPIYKLEPTRRWGISEIAGESIPIPAAARPADGSDHHMAVVTPDGWEYDFWDVESKPESGGTLRFGWGGKTRIDGDGLESNATAAHFGLVAGVIRAPELEAGHIDHALFMAVKCTDSGAATVYPAAPGTNDACSEYAGISDTNAPAMGARFVLQMSDAEIAALSVPSWKKTILTALAHYGMFVGDAFGGASWGLQFESGATYTSFGAEDKLAAFARREGVPTWKGQYVFDLNSGINWQSKLRVIAPCYTERSC